MMFLYSWVEAIWEVFSKIGKLVWVLLVNAWVPLLGLVTLIKYLWGSISDGIALLAAHTTALWAVLTDSINEYEAVMAAGWPSELANGIGFLNAFLPVTECCVFLGVLITAFFTCALIRVIKSWLPTVAS